MIQQAPTLAGVRGGNLPIRRILVVQTQRLGDVLCATPVFRALKDELPGVRVDALVQTPHEAILEANPDLDRVLTYNAHNDRGPLGAAGLRREIRQGNYDWALVIHAAATVAVAVATSGIPWRTCTWRYAERRTPHFWWSYSQQLRQDRESGTRHEIEHNLDLLRSLGLQAPDTRYRVTLTETERAWSARYLEHRGRQTDRPLAILHPGHGGGRQPWPAEHFAGLADRLSLAGWQVGLTGSERERSAIETLAGTCSHTHLVLAGETSVRELAAVLAQAQLFVSISTGPMHLASAVGVPAVTLYGPIDLRVEATRFCPHGSPSRAVLSPLPCPCPSSRTCDDPVCLRAITPDQVLQAALGLTARQDAGADAAINPYDPSL